MERAAEIEHAEETLGTPFPPFLRDALLNPSVSSHDYAENFFVNLSELVADNEEKRENGFWDTPWPTKYLSIGSDSMGGAYFVDTSIKQESVFHLGHAQNSSGREGFDSYDFKEWLEGLELDTNDLEEPLAHKVSSIGQTLLKAFAGVLFFLLLTLLVLPYCG